MPGSRTIFSSAVTTLQAGRRRGRKINIFTRRFKAWTRRRRVPAAVWRSFFLYTGLSLILYWCLDFFLDGALNDTNRIPTYWRAINLTAGVSPLVPLVSLIAGLYGWFWYSLQGLALFGEDRPQLPTADSLTVTRKKQGGRRERKDDLLRMLSRDWAGNKIEQLGSPFALSVWIVAGTCFFGLIAIGCWLFGTPAHSEFRINRLFCRFLLMARSVYQHPAGERLAALARLAPLAAHAPVS